MFDSIIKHIKNTYDNEEFIPLHIPQFDQTEKDYLIDCIDSTFVSSVGAYVDRFEKEIALFTGSKYAVAVVNGTSALHVSLHALGVNKNCEVITQPFTFVATANAIAYTGATSAFVDIEEDTLGMSPLALQSYLEKHAHKKNGITTNKESGKQIMACVPMHTFGFPCRIAEIAEICDEWGIYLVEDGAESLGSMVGEKHCGTFGKLGTLSFNGNKIITAGGGGAILTDDQDLAKRLKHLTTTAKIPHKWAYVHDELGFNYRMPNLNAALLCAQLSKLDKYLEAKRTLASEYETFFATKEESFLVEREGTTANYWLNTLRFQSHEAQQLFLKETNENGVMTRPAWELMHNLKMFKNDSALFCPIAEDQLKLVVNIPSTPIFS